MNVLVYNGPGVSKSSLSHTLNTLRTILLPHYTVQPITPHALATEPWAATCALLVLPGGRDLPYLDALQAANPRIGNYVHNGGSFLGICAGAYYACCSIEWELGTPHAVVGNRPLRFFDGLGRGCVYPSFQYESESGARVVSIQLPESFAGKEEIIEGLYYNGGGEFVSAEHIPNVTSLAKYTDGDAAGKTAAVLCKVSYGKAILWAVHIEYPITLEPTASAIAATRPDLKDIMDNLEPNRWKIIKQSLKLLGLKLPKIGSSANLQPLPQFLVSTPSASVTLRDMLENLKKSLPTVNPLILKDSEDIFQFHRTAYTPDLFDRILESDTTAVVNGIKHVIVVDDGTLPPKEATRHFDISRYFSTYQAVVVKEDLPMAKHRRSMGDILLYGEAITSTQTMLYKSPLLLSYLPTPLLSVATHQLAGRGRGSNTWLSPPGCLQFSLLLRLELGIIPSARLVFVQYLFALAVSEACRSQNVLGPNYGNAVRLKWPNDIYAVGAGSGAKAGPKKIGGILVNTSFSGSGIVDLIIGCGLNVLSPSPLTSLVQLIPLEVADPNAELCLEQTVAEIVASFDRLWAQFMAVRGSFEPFMDLYLSRWLHSDQVVRLTTVDPPEMVRIVGITPDHGLLRTIPVNGNYILNRGNQFIDLQPDGNSFDLMAGLIKTKQ